MTRRKTPSNSRLPADPLAWVEPVAADPVSGPPTGDAPPETADPPSAELPVSTPETNPVRSPAMTTAAQSAQRSDWENLTSAQALNVLSNPVMIATSDLVIRFVNDAAYAMFERIEDDIRRDLPHFVARDVIGKSIDVFHKKPEFQRRIMSGLTAAHDGRFVIGGQTLSFRATPVMDGQNKMAYVIVEWNDRTAEVAAKTQVDLLVKAIEDMTAQHMAGEIEFFMDTDGFTDDMRRVVEGANAMVREHISTKKKVLTVVQEFAQGNFDAPLEKFSGKRFFINDTIEQVRGAFRGVTSEIERLAQAISDGRLDVEVDASKFSGQYRRVVDALDRVLASMNHTVSRTSEQVEQIAGTVAMMAKSSTALATNSQIQSASVDEVSASTEETDAQVKANAAAAGTASQLVNSASVVAQDGRDKISQMVAAMEGIRVSSQDIAKIIKVIDEIAFQTNLLALNAAVEAARAGQHGRGFAVVAQEVRNLAGRSAKAARETSDYIEDATVRVRDGVRIADETSKSFGQIVDDIEKVRALVSDIATASEEQSRGVAQINIAIGEVARSALSTSQQADELAASSSQMQSAAEAMRQEMSRFSLRKAAATPLSAIPGLEMLPPEMLAQIQRMMAGNGGVPAALAMPVSNGQGPRSADHDERGFAGF